jgi:hypothetical protein
MPVIPSEGAYTETELRFIESQPPGLWPENQNSIFGQFRKVLCDELQARRDEIDMFALERFTPTSTRYLSLWEEMLGAAIAPTGKSTAQRRAVLHARMSYGAFRRTGHASRNDIIEQFVASTITGAGGMAAFSPSGIPFGAGGIPLYGAGGVVTDKYRVYEDLANFAYAVWIDSANVPDMNALTRELSRITPAGITLTFDTTKTGTALIDWGKTMLGLGPSGWWKLAADYNDYSGLAQHGTVTGAPTAIGSPGLVQSAGADAARDFSGAGQYVTIADSAPLNSGLSSVHAIVRPDTLPSSGNYRRAYSGNANNFLGIANIAGNVRFVFRVHNGTVSGEAVGNTLPVAGTTYRLLGTYDGITVRLYVNGLLQGSTPLAGPAVVSGSKYIGASPSITELWDGGLDEVARFGYPLSADQALYLSKQANNVL